MIYLDNAATTFPKPEETYRAINDALRTAGANPGRSGHRMALSAARLVYRCREQACATFQTKDPTRWIFCQNGTDALNQAIKGIVRGGMRVVTSVWDHNAVLRPLHQLQEDGYIELTVAQDVLGALRTQTFDLAVVSHASNVTGQCIDLATLSALCQKKKTLLILDAAQSAGHVNIDLSKTPVTMLCCPGHKGLYGPQGTGLLYIKDEVFLHTLREGGTGTHSDSVLQPYESPERYESGTLNTPGIAGLSAGIGFVQAHQKEIEEKEAYLWQLLYKGLMQIPHITLALPHPEKAAGQTGILSFLLPNRSSAETADTLDEMDIAVRGGLHCAPLAHRTLGTTQSGLVRISLGFFNTKEEILRTLDAVEQLAKAP